MLNFFVNDIGSFIVDLLRAAFIISRLFVAFCQYVVVRITHMHCLPIYLFWIGNEKKCLYSGKKVALFDEVS